MDSPVLVSTSSWPWLILLYSWSEPPTLTTWLRPGKRGPDYLYYWDLPLFNSSVGRRRKTYWVVPEISCSFPHKDDSKESFRTLTGKTMWLMMLLLLSHLRCCLLFSLSDIQMDIAVPRSTGNEHALEVEECACPQGYKGPSCQVLYTHKHIT